MSWTIKRVKEYECVYVDRVEDGEKERQKTAGW